MRLGRKMSYYNLFLCYSPSDRLAVQQVGDQLLEMDVLPWFDEWEIQPEQSWQEILNTQIPSINAVAVFVGKEGSAPWQDPQIDQLLQNLVHEHKIISVILPDCEHRPQLPDYIEPRWVDMRVLEPDPLTALIEHIGAD